MNLDKHPVTIILRGGCAITLPFERVRAEKIISNKSIAERTYETFPHSFYFNKCLRKLVEGKKIAFRCLTAKLLTYESTTYKPIKILWRTLIYSLAALLFIPIYSLAEANNPEFILP